MFRDCLFYQKIKEWKEKCHSNNSSEYSVSILKPKYFFKLGQTHTIVDLLIFRRVLVFFKNLYPTRFTYRGNITIIGRHSTIDSPDCVSLVSPPTITITKTRPHMESSHKLTCLRYFSVCSPMPTSK